MPEISIIVPVYKVEKYLHRCVDSILAQTFTDFELLLIDDGSPDLSGAICDEYAAKDDRIRVFHKENGGVSSARNLGLDNAQGKYIMFCDSDDSVDPQWCEKLYEHVHGDCLPICQFIVKDAADKTINHSNSKAGVFDAIDLPSIWIWTCWRAIYLSQIICDNNLRFNESISFSEDLMFNVDYLTIVGQYEVIEECLYNYYVVTESLSRKQYIPDRWEAELLYFDKYQNLCRANNNYRWLFFEEFVRCCNNTMQNTAVCFWERIRENNNHIRGRQFQACFPYARQELYTKLYLLLLKTKNYFWVWLLGQASNLKHKILHR